MARNARALVRNLAGTIALGLVSLLISLLIAEIALRMIGYEPRRLKVNLYQAWAAEDPEMGWVNRPGMSLSFESGHVAMNFESDGRRRDPAGNKLKNLPRVLVVGCSFTQGYGVADDETYSDLVNRSLASVELLNYGTGGYGTYQSLLRIRSYFKSPHARTPVVIYGLFLGHLARNVAPWNKGLTTADGRYLIPPNVRRRFGRFTEDRGGPVDLWPLETRSAFVTLVHYVVVSVLNRVTTPMAEDVFRHLMVEMERTVAENGASLLVVGLTEMPDWDWVWMREHGIDYVKCEHPDFWKDPTLQVGRVGHPNERMHQWWADCVLKALAERGLTAQAADERK